MIALLDNSQDLEKCEEQIGCPVEQLLTPLSRFRRRSDGMFAIDNGAFSGFDAKAFMALIDREREAKDKCRFVSCPDVVGSARRTLELFDEWRHRLVGWKLALVAQDGLEDWPIPWHEIDCLFIGGSTEWKLGRYAEECIRAAKAWGKWVHIGRVNGAARFDKFEALGADSFDGQGVSQHDISRFRIWRQINHPSLFTDTDSREMVSGSEVGLVGAAPVLGEIRENTEGQRA